MIDWLRSEIGGLMVAVLGFVLREFSENHQTPERIFEKKGSRFVARSVLAVAAGVVLTLVLPGDLAAHYRAAALAFAGMATPEIVSLLLVRGLARINRTTKDL
jgi:hypothetical protein